LAKIVNRKLADDLLHRRNNLRHRRHDRLFQHRTEGDGNWLAADSLDRRFQVSKCLFGDGGGPLADPLRPSVSGLDPGQAGQTFPA